MRKDLVLALILLIAVCAFAQPQAGAFDGTDKWKALLAANDVTALRGLYSKDPPARYLGDERRVTSDIAAETNFWQSILSSGISDLEVTTLEEQSQGPNLHLVTLQISMKVKTTNGPRVRYVVERQQWQQQGSDWRIVLVSHSAPVKMRPAVKANPNLYPKDADAKSEIAEAIARAGREHRRVILVFGANWCYDCHVLDQAFHQADIAPLLEKSFVVVHVDIGDDGKRNNDLAKQYRVPLEKGIPALAILDSDGKLLYSQENGEWESARSLDPDDVIAFLDKWKSSSGSADHGENE